MYFLGDVMKQKITLGIVFILIAVLALFTACSAEYNDDLKDSADATQDSESTDIEIPQCTHVYSEYLEDIAPTCQSEGKKTRICKICEFIDVEYLAKLPHSPIVSEKVEPSCENEGYSIFLCECGYTYKADFVAPTGHNVEKAEIVSKSCSTAGYTHYQCTSCEYGFDSDFIPQSHDFDISVVRPTVSQSGYTTYTCNECSYHYDNNFTKYTDILPSPYLESSEPLYKGIDIYDSNHKTSIDAQTGETVYHPLDWESIKAQGYDFVILKVGSNVSGKSKTFDMDYEGAKAAGLMVGAYYYAYSSTVAGTRSDALDVLKWIEGKQFEMPIYYDLEEEYLAQNLTKDALTELITVFVEELQRNGYYSALYINNNWLKNKLDTQAILDRFDIWYARYPQTENPVWDEAKYGKQLSMWQFDDQGAVDGIVGDVDLNYCYRDYLSLMKKWGLNGFEQEIETNEPTEQEK